MDSAIAPDRYSASAERVDSSSVLVAKVCDCPLTSRPGAGSCDAGCPLPVPVAGPPPLSRPRPGGRLSGLAACNAGLRVGGSLSVDRHTEGSSLAAPSYSGEGHESRNASRFHRSSNFKKGGSPKPVTQCCSPLNVNISPVVFEAGSRDFWRREAARLGTMLCVSPVSHHHPKSAYSISIEMIDGMNAKSMFQGQEMLRI